MRRMVLLLVAVTTLLSGCSAPPTHGLRSATAGESTAQHGIERAAPAPSRCAAPRNPVTTPPAHINGPFGSLRTTGSTAVALTFDDGPNPVNTPRMLDVLKECGVRATFCLIGNKVAANAEVVRRIAAEGHTLCNHSWQHNRDLGSYGPAAIRDDLQRTNNAIRAAVPGATISYFRAPGGFWTADYAAVARQLGMAPLDWDVDPWDWNFPLYGHGEAMTAHIVEHVRGHVRPGSIILSHDNQKPTTVEAYRRLLPWLTAHFTLVALPPDEPR